jgi:pyruvate/2-oxoglutarate/acetoin dehydrogenase E1 component
VGKTRRAVVVHEAVRPFGVGAEIAAMLHERLFGRLLAPVQRVGAPHCPVPFSKPLELAFLPQPSVIEAAIRQALA